MPVFFGGETEIREEVIPISISMPPDPTRRTRVLAAQEGKSRSRFVCEVLQRVLPPADIGDVAQARTRPANIEV
ncbi:MAG: hypothetical protein SWK90_14330 [Chloroflexota bacterium]|nr:hypothetical protein [Chloroflexota bacterium]